MNKEEAKRLAALTFTEKIDLLEKLRDRMLAFIEAREQLARKKQQDETQKPKAPVPRSHISNSKRRSH